MKLPSTVLSALSAAAVAVAAFPSPAGAWSLFSGERSRLWHDIGEAREKADAERDEGRVMGEIEALSDVGRMLSEMADRFPEYKAGEVASFRAEVADRMRELMAGVRSGEIAVPEPDAAWRGEDAAAVSNPAAKGASGPAEGPAFRLGIPDLVRVDSRAAPDPAADRPAPAPGEFPAAEFPAPSPAEDDLSPDLLRLRSSIPNPFFDGASAPFGPPDASAAPDGPAESASGSPSGPPDASELPPPPLPAPPAPSAAASPAPPSPAPAAPEAKPAPAAPAAEPSISVSVRPSSVPVSPSFSDDDPAVQLRAVAEMIRTARAPDAVILLEDIVRAPGAEPPVEARVLLARALLECGNYPRAVEELSAVPDSAASDPAVCTLRAAAFLASGRPQEAFLQLDLLLEEHPDWSDAYVDCAYVMFLLDPRGNRDDAIDFYRNGLSRGARRDPRLERELGIRVER